METTSIGIYVHIPFCKRKCGYCSFYSAPSDYETRKAYAKALARNIGSYAGRDIACDSVFFGGGTPTVMETELLCSVMDKIKSTFILSPDAELTIEANPESADFEKLHALRKTGFNRISFGVQSASDEELEALGRLHDRDAAVRAVMNAREAGFENISCDMMIGIPKQTEDSLLMTADVLCELPITHLSAYMLSVEEGTPFFEKGVKADEDRISSMYLRLIKRLEEHGFSQYEISNFAREGNRCRHNLKYWKAEEYLGFGCRAHSFFENVRYSCEADIREYIGSDVQPKTVLETAPDKLEEYIMLGLRLTDGISYETLESLGADSAKTSKLRKLAIDLADKGLCKASDKGFSLTPEGFLVSNDIIGIVELC